MRIALCDARSDEAKKIVALLKAYQKAHPQYTLLITIFSSCAELLSAAESQGPYDLYLLDVLMPDMTGIDLAEQLTRQYKRPRIIFLTASADYALDAFRVRAHNYLLKPVEPASFFTALDEILPACEGNRAAAVTIPTVQNVDLTLPVAAIAYAECVAHTVHYHLTDGRRLESRTLRVPFSQTVAPLLDSGKFVVIHRSFVVNLEQVQHVTNSSVRMSDGAELTVARLRQRDIRVAYIDYLSHAK